MSPTNYLTNHAFQNLLKKFGFVTDVKGPVEIKDANINDKNNEYRITFTLNFPNDDNYRLSMLLLKKDDDFYAKSIVGQEYMSDMDKSLSKPDKLEMIVIFLQKSVI
ncbi:hypothetical protein [Priestia megaterium]|uniref:hypothetical protein n=1 Tax=Priestia megaterium TaxID=1404 RepID=UPI00345954B4